MFSICFAPKSHLFIFFFSSCAQKEDVYNAVAHDAISDVLNGFNATVFAYGQTGAGKVRAKQREAKKFFKIPQSFTMFGGGSEDLAGIIPRASKHIFDHM